MEKYRKGGWQRRETETALGMSSVLQCLPSRGSPGAGAEQHVGLRPRQGLGGTAASRDEHVHLNLRFSAGDL